MKRIHLALIFVVLLVVLGVSFLYAEGMLDSIFNSQATLSADSTSASLSESTATAEPTATPEPDFYTAVIDDRNVFIGDEDAIIEYVNDMDQQEWLDFATITTDEDYQYYGRVKEDEVIVKNDEGETINAGEVTICEELSVLRAGNAFIIEDKDAEVEIDTLTKKVATMSDKNIYKLAFDEEEEAIFESAALDKVYTKATNVVGTLRVKDGFNPDLLKALVLVRYEVLDENGTKVTVYAIEWHIVGCDGAPYTEPTTGGNNGGNGGNGGGNDNKPTATPTVTPTVTPTPTPTPSPSATPDEKHEPDRPTKTPTPTETVRPTATPNEEHEPDRTVRPTATPNEAHATVRPTSTPNTNHTSDPTKKPSDNVIKEYPDAPVTGGTVSKDDDVFENSSNVIKEYDNAPVTSGTVSSDPDEFACNESFASDRQVAVASVEVVVEKNVESASTDRQKTQVATQSVETSSAVVVEEKTSETVSSDRQKAQSTEQNVTTTQGEISTDEDEFDD